MAISETSNAASRTIGLKPLWAGEKSTKSNATVSDLIAPFFNAAVPGWSPSSVRRRMATSVFLRLVDIDEAGLRQRLAHIVHVESELAFGEQLALALFVCGSLLAFCNHVGGIAAPDHHDPVVIGDHGIAGKHVDPGANHRHVDGAERRLDGALGGNRLRPHRKTHFPKRLGVADTG